MSGPTTEQGTRTSDSAVRDATGRGWQEWFAWLERHDAGELDHPEIVALLQSDADLASGWWRQSVTVAFEQHIGRRAPGSTADGSFQVGTRRTFRSTPTRAWNIVAAPEGAEAWLGEPVEPWWRGEHGGPEKGDVLEARSGERFEVRSVAPGARIRLRCLGPRLPERSTIQLTLGGERGRSVLVLHHEGLPSSEVREAMREHWQRALERMEALFVDE